MFIKNGSNNNHFVYLRIWRVNRKHVFYQNKGKLAAFSFFSLKHSCVIDFPFIGCIHSFKTKVSFAFKPRRETKFGLKNLVDIFYICVLSKRFWDTEVIGGRLDRRRQGRGDSAASHSCFTLSPPTHPLFVHCQSSLLVVSLVPLKKQQQKTLYALFKCHTLVLGTGPKNFMIKNFLFQL